MEQHFLSYRPTDRVSRASCNRRTDRHIGEVVVDRGLGDGQGGAGLVAGGGGRLAHLQSSACTGNLGSQPTALVHAKPKA